jgi:hypothetical protein
MEASAVLFVLVVMSRTVVAGDLPENYVVREYSESPDGDCGVLVLSQQAAIAQSDEEKAKLTESRIRTLQELLW